MTANEKEYLQKKIAQLEKEVVQAKTESDEAEKQFELLKRASWKKYLDSVKSRGKTFEEKVTSEEEARDVKLKYAAAKEKYLKLKAELESTQTKLRILES